MNRIKKKVEDFPGGPVTKTVIPVQEAWVQSLVRELDLTLHQGVHMLQLKMKDLVCCNQDPAQPNFFFFNRVEYIHVRSFQLYLLIFFLIVLRC